MGRGDKAGKEEKVFMQRRRRLRRRRGSEDSLGEKRRGELELALSLSHTKIQQTFCCIILPRLRGGLLLTTLTPVSHQRGFPKDPLWIPCGSPWSQSINQVGILRGSVRRDFLQCDTGIKEEACTYYYVLGTFTRDSVRNKEGLQRRKNTMLCYLNYFRSIKRYSVGYIRSDLCMAISG